MVSLVQQKGTVALSKLESVPDEENDTGFPPLYTDGQRPEGIRYSWVAPWTSRLYISARCMCFFN